MRDDGDDNDDCDNGGNDDDYDDNFYPVIVQVLSQCHDGIAVTLHFLTQYDLFVASIIIYNDSI